MARVVLFLDDDTQTAMRGAAKEAGISESQWVADLIRKNAPEGDAAARPSLWKQINGNGAEQPRN